MQCSIAKCTDICRNVKFDYLDKIASKYDLSFLTSFIEKFEQHRRLYMNFTDTAMAISSEADDIL